MTSISNIAWVETHRPTTLDDIIGNEHIVARLKEWAESGETPNVLFHGPAGTGKTAMATAFARDLYGDDWKVNFVEMNASDERGIDVVRNRIKTVAEQSTGGYDYKVIFLDESDSLTKESQAALRRVMEDYADRTRFFLSCNFPNKLIDPIQSRCVPFRVSPLDDDDIVTILQDVAEEHGVEYDEEALWTIAGHTRGDARKAINTLQAAKLGDRIGSEGANAVVDTVNQSLVDEIVDLAIAGELEEAQSKLHEDILKEGVSSQALADRFMRAVRSRDDIPADSKIKMYDKLGEADWRTIEGANPHVAWSSFVAHLCVARHLSLSTYRDEGSGA